MVTHRNPFPLPGPVALLLLLRSTVVVVVVVTVVVVVVVVVAVAGAIVVVAAVTLGLAATISAGAFTSGLGPDSIAATPMACITPRCDRNGTRMAPSLRRASSVAPSCTSWDRDARSISAVPPGSIRTNAPITTAMAAVPHRPATNRHGRQPLARRRIVSGEPRPGAVTGSDPNTGLARPIPSLPVRDACQGNSCADEPLRAPQFSDSALCSWGAACGRRRRCAV